MVAVVTVVDGTVAVVMVVDGTEVVATVVVVGMVVADDVAGAAAATADGTDTVTDGIGLCGGPVATGTTAAVGGAPPTGTIGMRSTARLQPRLTDVPSVHTRMPAVCAFPLIW